MARQRTIKPEFFEDEVIGGLSPAARLLYIGMWVMMDDEGRMRASEGYVRSRVFPYDDGIDIAVLLAELASAGRIVLYRNHGQVYAWCPTFKRHQYIQKATPSRLPSPDDSVLEEYGSSTVALPEDVRTSTVAVSASSATESESESESESDSDSEREDPHAPPAGDATPAPVRAKRVAFVKPDAIKELLPYIEEHGGTRKQAREFWLHFEANGWRVGSGTGKPMRDWRAAAQLWISRDADKAPVSKPKAVSISAYMQSVMDRYDERHKGESGNEA